MLKVLSTKQLDMDLTAKAQEMGIALTCLDFISIRDVDFDSAALLTVVYDALVFTSSNAVRSFFKHDNIAGLIVRPTLQGGGTKPIYALSGKTSEELLKYNIVPVATADNAAALADRIIADGYVRAALHICGDLALDTLEQKLAAEGLSYLSLVVYETTISSHALTEHYDAVMLYSPSGVDSYTAKNKPDAATLYCCIGETTASSLKRIDDGIDIILSKQPSPEGMLTAIGDLKKAGGSE